MNLQQKYPEVTDLLRKLVNQEMDFRNIHDIEIRKQEEEKLLNESLNLYAEDMKRKQEKKLLLKEQMMIEEPQIQIQQPTQQLQPIEIEDEKLEQSKISFILEMLVFSDLFMKFKMPSHKDKYFNQLVINNAKIKQFYDQETKGVYENNVENLVRMHLDIQDKAQNAKSIQDFIKNIDIPIQHIKDVYQPLQDKLPGKEQFLFIYDQISKF